MATKVETKNTQQRPKGPRPPVKPTAGIKPAKQAKAVPAAPTTVEVDESITVRDLAQIMERSPIDLIKVLMQFGIMAPITQSIDHDTAVIVGEELGVQVIRPKRVEVAATPEELAAIAGTYAV